MRPLTARLVPVADSPHEGCGPLDLYALKPRMLRALDPIVDGLARSGIQADVVTLTAIPVAAVAGAAVLVSPDVPVVLLVVPVAAALRLVSNLLDGALARRTGRVHPRGELYNEVGDRVADVLMLAPVAFVPGAIAPLVWLGIVLSLIASFTSVATRAAGGPRSYRGVLSKPGRMVLLSVTALAVVVVGQGPWAAFGPLLIVGAALTLVERLHVALRELA